jgi:CubicO group peptidase (beta-lactamase class C family)
MADLQDLTRELISEAIAPAVALGCAARAAGKGGFVREVSGAEIYFDLASLTKPMTAVAVARSGLPRKTRLRDVVPELDQTASADATIELLLAHRAGLLAHLPLFEPLVSGGSVDTALALLSVAGARRDDALGPIPPEGFAPLYSDLGYILAGVALARHAGSSASSERGPHLFDAGDAIARYVIDLLGAGRSLGTARQLAERGVDLARHAAPTEAVAWRGGEVRGVVHDENAWALTGEGGSGHAGMFGTVGAVLDFGCAVLDLLEARDDLRWLVRERPGGTLRAGFDGKSAEGSSAGTNFGPRSFVHLGFTGTSLWIDPDEHIVAVLLTNRVCPTRDNVAIREARPWVHDALWERACAIRKGPP